jgi:hypothetical protein
MSMELEAPDWSNAHAMAIDLAERCDVRPPHSDEVGVSVTVERHHSASHDKIRQLGEPWCWAQCLERTAAHGGCTVVVVHRSAGNRLSEPDVQLLRRRIEAMGIRIMDAWNGAGLDHGSFKCETEPTAEQLEQLCAPRDGR